MELEASLVGGSNGFNGVGDKLDPLNCQMQSTRILLTGGEMTCGESEIWDISVLSVADVVFEPDPDKSKVTDLSGKICGDQLIHRIRAIRSPYGTSRLLDAFHRPGVRCHIKRVLHCGRCAEDVAFDDSSHHQPADGQSHNHLNQHHSRLPSQRELNDFLIWTPYFHRILSLPAKLSISLAE